MQAEELVLGTIEVRGENAGHTLKCDAIAVDRTGPGDGRILLLSAAGPATQVKALTAALRSKARVTFHPHLEVKGFHCWKARRFEGGYRVYRSRLDGDLWHVLCVADAEGFLPVLTEESLWRELRGLRFTTPVLRPWVPWLMERLRERRLLVPLQQAGCSAGWLVATTEHLDGLVSEGVKGGELKLGGGLR